MRKSAWILAGLIIVALVAIASTAPADDTSKDKGTGPVTATGTTSVRPVTASGTTSTPKATAKTKVSKWDHTSGEVTAVDATAKTLTVKAKAGDKSFKWDDKTVVTPKGSSPAVGDHVTLTTAKDSDLATKIAIRKATTTKPTPPPAA
ncbi:MAG: hypothetical protein WAM82_04135 [Thermoanaerobaculia bacterium]